MGRSTSIQNNNSGGHTSLTIEESALMNGTQTETVQIVANSTLDLSVGGSLHILANDQSSTKIISNGTTSIQSENLFIEGNSATITNSSGNLNVSTENQLSLENFSDITLNGGNGNLNITTGTSGSGGLSLDNGSSILNSGSGNTIFNLAS